MILEDEIMGNVIKLHEMAQYYSEVIEGIETPEQTEEAFKVLDALDVSVKEKVESIGDIITNYLADEAALKAEAKRLNERAAKHAKEAAKLQDYVKYVMEQNNFDKLDGLKYTFSFTTSESLKCTDVNLLPAKFKKIAYSADISAMKAHLKKAYDDKGTKLVNKPSKKPKGKEMLYTELNDSIRDMGLEFVINKTLKMK
jgi:hypothetical protein